MSELIADKELVYGVESIKPISIQFDDYTSVSLVSDIYGDGIAIFKNGSGNDLSSTHMPSGAAAVSGNIVTTKPIQDLVGGNYYIVAVVVEVNGTSQREHVYVRINCPQEKSGLMRRK
jgi:hypothetical protein